MMRLDAPSLLKKILTEKESPRIKLLGDSITHGVGGSGFLQNGETIVGEFKRNPDGYCWAKSFAAYMKEKYSATVINNACTGTNVQFVLNNFDTLTCRDDDIVICTIGTNNRHQMKDNCIKKSREEMEEIFYSNLIALNNKFESEGIPVIFVANIPASPKNEKDTDTYWRILHMDDIARLYKKASDECGFPLVSMYDAFSDYCKETGVDIDSLLGDTLHPNDKGYDVMTELIIKELQV